MNDNLYALFVAQARSHPEAVAVVVGQGEFWRYGQLAERAAQVAAYLISAGVKEEEPVGVMMSRTPEMVAVLLGILKCGAAYVPIDPDDPPRRQRLILEQSGCRLVIAHRSRMLALRSVLSREETTQLGLRLVDVADIPVLVVDPYADVAPGGERLAYILFTSGSTGLPKGVEIEHRNLMSLLLAASNLFGMREDDCYLATSTIGFDISVVEIFLPLMTGGRLLLRDRAALLDPVRLAADLRAHSVTCMQTGPSMWSVLLAEVRVFPRLRVAVSTAEAISTALAHRLADCADHVWNLYGPTETTIWSTGYRITSEGLAHDIASSMSVPIGQPLINTEVLILDDAGHLVHEGAQGELCLGGLGVGRGYRGDRVLTDARFVFIRGMRYYRTGDVASWSPEGLLLYHGRIDDQMKIRGVRVDPSEVEAALMTHPAVAQAAATWFETPGGMRSIIAAMVAGPSGAPDASMLHAWLQERLPDPLIPSRYVFLASLPLSPSGKIDRGAIRVLRSEAIDPGRDHAAKTPTELALVEIWKRVLQAERVALDDHFFVVGGDSLAAVGMLLEVESALGTSLPVEAVFRHPTLRELAAEIDRVVTRKGRRGWLGRLRARWAPNRVVARAVAPVIPVQPALPEDYDYAPVTDPALVLPRQHTYVDTWEGRRLYEGALVVGLNVNKSVAGLFWCFQGYRELSQLAGHLGAGVPVFGMRSGYLIINFEDPAHVEVLASRYAAEINAIQPEGPLVLGGNCSGGRVIHAVAQKLRASGREIELLILMELRIPLPHDGKVALIFGRESHLNPYAASGGDPDSAFRENYPGGYEVALIKGAHGQYFESPNIESLAAILTRLLADASVQRAKPALSLV